MISSVGLCIIRLLPLNPLRYCTVSNSGNNTDKLDNIGYLYLIILFMFGIGDSKIKVPIEEKIPLENLLVVADDLALPFGTLRMKKKGSDGGHNGLSDIAQILNTTDYNRLRFGVGSDFQKGKQVDYVLGKWDTEEQKTLFERIDISVEIVKSFIGIGVDRTMSQYNNK